MIFYSKASPCPFLINSLTSVLKSTKISGHLILCDFQDHLVANSLLKLKTDSSHVEEAVATIKSDVKYKLISDHHQSGHKHKCLDYSPGRKILYSKPTKLYSKFILIHDKNIDDTYCNSNAVQLQNRRQWEITSKTIPHESLCWDYV